jgi:cell division protein FtsW (lipid II flippase)
MTNHFNRLQYAVFLLLISGTTLIAQAPASSNSPYSDQKFTPPDNPAWYETPTLWIALILVVIVLIVMRMRKKQEKYT